MFKWKRKTANPAGFRIADKVRVRHGVTDADYPDMTIGGWAGTIAEVHDDGMYTVRWSAATLAAIHPIFKKRSLRDGLDDETYVLSASDLEPDAGGALAIEEPKMIATKPLSPKDQEDRIRMVFCLTSNDPLPNVDEATLTTYREYLSKKLAFPFTAVHSKELGHRERVRVTSFGDPDDEAMIDEMYGILCDARREVGSITLPVAALQDVKGKPNRQLIDDYCYWFCNWC